MVIIDASVWIDYLRGISTPQTEWLDSHVGEQRLGLTDISLCEVLQGVRDHEAARIRDYLLSFEIFSTGGTELALAAGRELPRSAQVGNHGPKDDRLLDRRFLSAGRPYPPP